MDRLNASQRENSGSIQIFWFKYDLMIEQLETMKYSLGEEFLPMRCLKALNLNYGQRTAVLMALGCQGLNHCALNLRNCAIKLFGTYKTLIGGLSSEKQVMWAENDTDQIEEDEDTYIASKKKTTRNRPGLEQLAIKRLMEI